jgi:alpha-tubulin suppressor-like RCC1 family protein
VKRGFSPLARFDLRGVLWSLLLLPGCTESVAIFEPRESVGQPGDAGGDAQQDAAPPEGSARLLAAFEHTCAVDDDGTICWGPNDSGKLGLGSEGGVERTPRRSASTARYSQLCAGENHACGLRDDGEIECWGSNPHGQLGLGDRTARHEPTPLRSGSVFTALSCGGEASCAVTDDGSLYCWGDNREGMGGQDDPYDSPDLLKPSKAALARGVRQVSLGQGHGCAVMTSGAVYCWGRNTESQLGLGPTQIQLRVPKPVDAGNSYLQVAAAQSHSCGIRKDGHLFCWGSNIGGLLGLGQGSAKKFDTPQQVGSLSDFREVSANWFHSCARREKGILMCWGRNDEGQLGMGDMNARDVPTRVQGPSAWGSFSVGRFHTCALDTGNVYCWGQNQDGQLGRPEPERSLEPLRTPLELAQ